MKIENGTISTFLRPEYLALLNEKFNESHPDINETISVNLNWRKPDGSEWSYDEIEDIDQKSEMQSEKVVYFRYVLSYKHPMSKKESVYIEVEQTGEQIDVSKGISDVLDIYVKQTRNCEHDFVRPKDVFGKEYPDGRAVCTHCELMISGVLPVIHGIKVISMSCSQDVVAQYDWGNAYIQGGDYGVVVQGAESYTTAFMEAFPKIHGFGTFIRGEGESITAAENDCWASYQRKLNCSAHEWSRFVRGQHRTDGYAQCIHCGLCTSDAIQPETLCKVCKTPTTNTHNDEFICLSHYYELPEDERAAAYSKMMSDHRSSEKCQAQYDFDYRFIERIQSYAFGQVGAERYNVIKSQLRSVLGWVKHNFYVLMLNSHPLKRNHDYNEESHAKMAECHTHIMQNWPVILEYLDGVIENRNSTEVPKKLRGVHAADVIPAQYLRDNKEVL